MNLQVIFDYLTGSKSVSLVIVATLFFSLSIFLHGDIEQLWWTYDDAQVLTHTYQFSPWEYFFSPLKYQYLSGAHLTPWISLSFDLDLWLFGLKPYWFFAHQLISLVLTSIITYLFLRLWVSNLWAIMGGVLFINGSVIIVFMHQLMTRHYLEGLFFCIFALYLYVIGQQKKSIKLIWLGAFCYFLSASSKELYVPLVALLPILTIGLVRNQWRYWLPYILVAIAYSLWRKYMLGVWIGGYGKSEAINWEMLLLLPQRILTQMFGSDYLLLTSLIIISIFIYLIVSYRSIWPILIFFLLLLPIIPASSQINSPINNRLFILIWWAMCVAVILSANKFSKLTSPWLSVIFVILLASLISMNPYNIKIKKILLQKNKEFSSSGKIILNQQSPQKLFFDEKNVWGIANLAWLRKHILELQEHTIMFDQIEVFENLKNTDSFKKYNKSCLCFKELIVEDFLSDWLTQYTDKKQLSVRFFRDEEKLSTAWEFGPYDKGSYHLIEHKYIGKMWLPKSGYERFIRPEPIEFRIRYNSPDGWVTYSPIIPFSWKAKEISQWSRLLK